MAVRFDADGEDYTRTTNLPNGSTFTICCWVKISTDRNTFTTVWSLDNGTGDYTYMQTSADGTTLKVEADGTSTGTLSMTVGTWYFVAFTQSGGTGTFYHAAATAADLSSAANTLSSVTSGNLRIGESPFGSEWLNGCVAAFKCWSGVALTSAELANERWFAAPVRTDSLNCWHPFEIAETVDYSGNGYTLSGGSGASTEDGPPIHWSGDQGTVIPAAGGGTTHNADGNESITATATGTAAVDRAASGNESVTASATGTAAVDRSASGDQPVTVTATGTAAVDRAASGNEAVTATIGGTANVDPAISGNESITASITGTAAVDRAASGDVAITATSTGTAAVDRPVSGDRTVSVSITGDAEIGGRVDVDGNRAITTTATGTAALDLPISGDRAVTVAITGTAAVDRAASGNLAITVTATGYSDEPAGDGPPITSSSPSHPGRTSSSTAIGYLTSTTPRGYA